MNESGLENVTNLTIWEEFILTSIPTNYRCEPRTNVVVTICLVLSIGSSAAGVLAFCCFENLRIFRNLLWSQVMGAALSYSMISLLLQIDSTMLNSVIHSQGAVCTICYFFLEYCKCLVIFWIFIETCFLHNTAVWPVFTGEARLIPWLLIGYTIPLVHTSVSFGIYLGTVVQFLGDPCYIEHKMYYVYSVPMMLELTGALILVFNTFRALWCNTYRDQATVWIFRETNLQSLVVILWSYGMVINPFVSQKFGTSLMAALEGFVIVLVFFLRNKPFIRLKNKKQRTGRKKVQKRISHGKSFEMVDIEY